MGKQVNIHLTERFVKAADHGGGKLKVLIRDDELSGFGLCIYPNGSKGFFLDYRIAGRRRYYTIGAWPTWSVVAARERARELKRRIDQGEDPTAQRQEAREAATVRDLIGRYLAEHGPKLAPRNKADQESKLRKLVEPEWGTRKVADITETDVDRLLAKIATGRARPRKEQPKRQRAKPLAKAKATPIRANRVGEVLRKMFNLAVKPWGMRADNPAAGFHRNPENEREVFLTPAQIESLATAIDAHKNQRAADIIRMILLTGARKGEVLGATPEQFNLDLAIWTKNASTTKQRKMHRVPLSRAAVQFLRTRIDALPADAGWLFPGESKEGRTEDIRRFWTEVRAQTGFEGVRIHDLRHTFASLLASGGMSLPMIGKLLGHSSPKTTQRYAHLLDDPIRQGVDAIGDMLRPKLRLVPKAESENAA
jgi:integrase